MEILGLVSIPGWLVSLLALVLTLYIYGRHKHNYFKSLGIHSRSGTFMLGDLPVLLKKGFNYLDAELLKEQGKVFGVYMGNKPWLVVSDTDLIKEITVKQFHKFTNRNRPGPVHKRWDSALSIAEGSHWKFLRSTLSPTFSSGKLRDMGPLIGHCLKELHNNVEDRTKENPDGFDMIPLLNGLTMDVICNTGFGIQVNAQTDKENTFVRHARALLEVNFTMLPALFPDLEFVLNLFPTNFIPIKTYEYLKTATMSAFTARKDSDSMRRRVMRRLIWIQTVYNSYQEFASIVQRNKTHSLQKKQKDLLQLMINAHKGEDSTNEGNYTYAEFKKRGLTDDEVLVNSILFMSAGYDTTASALSWCVYHLAIQPEIQNKLVQEIDAELGKEVPSYDNVAKLHYLDMVMNETLRMHPPAGRFDRIVVEDTEINGVQFKKDMIVVIPTLALHYMPEYWESPNEFKPERFAPENQHNVEKHAFLPFGQGPRHCIAMRLAHLEFKMTIASLVQRYHFVKSEKLQIPMPMAPTFITRPEKPIMIKVTHRKL